MLEPQKNRIDYGEQLFPPPGGYALDYAVGTTYSLDLETAMILPVALIYSQPLEASLDKLQYGVFSAILNASKKITIYHQKDKRKVPKGYHGLMACLEKGMEGIQMPSFESSFHPKTWVIRFTANKKPAFYRFLVTSRNMTASRDWDVAFTTEGYVGPKKIGRTAPLIEFLRYLSGAGKRPLPAPFIKELSRVDFSSPEGCKLVNIFPLGLPHKEYNGRYTAALLQKKWKDLLVMSPFVDNSTLSLLAKKSPLTVLSRKDEIDGLNPTKIREIGEERFFQLSKHIRDAEFNEDINDAQGKIPRPQDLHAKLFIGESGRSAHWFLGSANCTGPAIKSNIELMVELKTDDWRYFPGQIASQLTDPSLSDHVIFEPYDLKGRCDPSDLACEDRELRKIIYNVSALQFSGKILPAEATGCTLFGLLIECDATGLDLPKGYEVRIKPLPERQKNAVRILPGRMNRIQDFSGYTEIQLSPFLEVEVWFEGEMKKSFLPQMEIELPASRLDRIISSIFSSHEQRMQYILFLLSGVDFTMSQSGHLQGRERKEGESKPGLSYAMPFFEKLLLSASRSPERIRLIDEWLSRFEKGSEGSQDQHELNEFRKLLAIFKEYTENNPS